MKFLEGLFERKGASSSGAVNRSTGGVAGQQYGHLTSGPWDTERAIRDGFERVIWVFRCVDVIAQNQASIPIIIKDENDRDGKTVEDKQLYALLNKKPNPYETAMQFRYRLSAMLLLSRRGAFIELVRKQGRVVAMYILPSHQVEPIPDPKTFVSQYKVTGHDGQVSWLDPDQVIWIRAKPHPTDMYAQMTPMVAASLAADTDYFARMFNRNFLANDGRPGLLIGLKGQLGPDDAEEIKQRFSGGPAQAGRTTVVEIDDITIQDLTGNPRDAQWLEAIRGSKEDILLAFGVPESVMGNASGRTFDNADAERWGFWNDTMTNHCNSIANGFDVLTINGYLDSLVCAYDYTKVDVLNRVKRENEDRAMARYAAGAITWNQLRDELGYEPWPDNALANCAILPNGFAIAKSGADQAAVMQMHALGQPPVDPAAAAESGAARGAAQGIAKARRIDRNDQAARSLRLAKILDPHRYIEQKAITTGEDVVDAEVLEDEIKDHPYAADRIVLEAEIEGMLGAWSRRQEKVVSERLRGVKTRKNTRHDIKTAGTRPLDAEYVVNTEQWASDLREDFEAVLKPVAIREAKRVLRQLKREGVIHTVSDRIVNENLNTVLEKVEDAARNQSRRVAKKIGELDESGKSLKQIDAEVRGMIGTRSSWRKGLSTFATTALMEGARDTVYSSLGSRATGTWRTQEDERVRATHKSVDGVSKKGNERFRVGGGLLKYPGDPNGPIEETINCRCFKEWTVN